MTDISREVALHYAAKAMAARMIEGAVTDIESEHSILIPSLTRESRQTIAQEMRAIAASVDCEQTQYDLAKRALEGEALAVERARAGAANMEPIRFPACLMDGQDGD